jgi:hypothetical protein
MCVFMIGKAQDPPMCVRTSHQKADKPMASPTPRMAVGVTVVAGEATLPGSRWSALRGTTTTSMSAAQASSVPCHPTLVTRT